jgi:hypothetical protein
MPIIDPNKNPVGLDKRLETCTDPRHRKMLEEVRYHIAVEAGGDVESAIQRLAPNCEYVLYEHGKPTVTIRGVDAIRRDFYQGLLTVIDYRLEWDVVLCMVDGNSVITEGQQKNAVLGKFLVQMGFDVDPNGLYLQDAHHLVIWPFDEQLRLVGETVYFGSSTPYEEVAKRPLRPEDIGSYVGPIVLPSA